MPFTAINPPEAVAIIQSLVNESFDDYYTVYGRFTKPVKDLWALLGQIDEVATIFSSVIEQAATLNKPADWIETELYFEVEANMPPGQRLQLMKARLVTSGASDDALDLYNQRRYRFEPACNEE